MKLTRIIQETDERLRELERRWRESNSPEDYDAYITSLSRTVPGLREAIQNYESTSEAVQDIDTPGVSDADESLLNQWIRAGEHLDTLLQQHDIPYACDAGYGGCTKQGSFRQDPYAADIYNDPYSYGWMCDNCAYERSQDI